MPSGSRVPFVWRSSPFAFIRSHLVLSGWGGVSEYSREVARKATRGQTHGLCSTTRRSPPSTRPICQRTVSEVIRRVPMAEGRCHESGQRTCSFMSATTCFRTLHPRPRPFPPLARKVPHLRVVDNVSRRTRCFRGARRLTPRRWQEVPFVGAFRRLETSASRGRRRRGKRLFVKRRNGNPPGRECLDHRSWCLHRFFRFDIYRFIFVFLSAGGGAPIAR